MYRLDIHLMISGVLTVIQDSSYQTYTLMLFLTPLRYLYAYSPPDISPPFQVSRRPPRQYDLVDTRTTHTVNRDNGLVLFYKPLQTTKFGGCMGGICTVIPRLGITASLLSVVTLSIAANQEQNL